MRTCRGEGIEVPLTVSFSLGGKVNEDGRDCAIRKDALTSKLLNGCRFILISKVRRIRIRRQTRDSKQRCKDVVKARRRLVYVLRIPSPGRLSLAILEVRLGRLRGSPRFRRLPW